VISVRDTGPKGRGFKSGRVYGFLRAIKIRSSPSFGWEVKPEAPCRKILRHVKITSKYERGISNKKFIILFAVLPGLHQMTAGRIAGGLW
jgi:hypothetical protein